MLVWLHPCPEGGEVGDQCPLHPARPSPELARLHCTDRLVMSTPAYSPARLRCDAGIQPISGTRLSLSMIILFYTHNLFSPFQQRMGECIAFLAILLAWMWATQMKVKMLWQLTTLARPCTVCLFAQWPCCGPIGGHHRWCAGPIGARVVASELSHSHNHVSQYTVRPASG